MPDPTHEALERTRAAVDAGDWAAAWRGLEPLASDLDRELEVASLWLTLLRVTPNRPTLVEEARRILARFGDRPGLVVEACDALIRCAERVPPDEAQPSDGAAALALAAADRCLEESASETNPETHGYLLIDRANALRLLRAHAEALATYERALELYPDRGHWWFSLGLLHKARGAFDEGLAANRRARELLGDEKGVLWNIAICATALGDGESAVEAMGALGHPAKLGESGMPYVDGLPPVQVRAASVGAGLGPAERVPDRSVGFELFWVTPLSPCHGVVSSPSHRVASIDFGDVVLWDGVPVGVTEYSGRPVPRFPLLCVLRKGSERRFRFVALQQGSGEVEALARDLPDGVRLFAQRERIEQMCPRCASGEHAHPHEHMPAEEHRLVYGKLIVPGDFDLAAFRADLDKTLRLHSGVQLVAPELLEAVGDTPAAGKAHQAWRGLERAAARKDRRSS